MIFWKITKKCKIRAPTFDSTKALINKTGLAPRFARRQPGFCRAFVESIFWVLTVEGQIIARFGCKLRRNYTQIARKKRDTGGAQNWPRRFAPRPILGVGGVAFFACNFGVIST